MNPGYQNQSNNYMGRDPSFMERPNYSQSKFPKMMPPDNVGRMMEDYPHRNPPFSSSRGGLMMSSRSSLPSESGDFSQSRGGSMHSPFIRDEHQMQYSDKGSRSRGNLFSSYESSEEFNNREPSFSGNPMSSPSFMSSSYSLNSSSYNNYNERDRDRSLSFPRSSNFSKSSFNDDRGSPIFMRQKVTPFEMVSPHERGFEPSARRYDEEDRFYDDSDRNHFPQTAMGGAYNKPFLLPDHQQQRIVPNSYGKEYFRPNGHAGDFTNSSSRGGGISRGKKRAFDHSNKGGVSARGSGNTHSAPRAFKKPLNEQVNSSKGSSPKAPNERSTPLDKSPVAPPSPKSNNSDKTTPPVNANSTEEEDLTDESNRVSALKRLGPKLGIVHRLGNKVPKTEDIEKVTIKIVSADEKVDDKSPDETYTEEKVPPIKHIKVVCPHCGTSGTTKQEYSRHFTEDIHKNAIKQLKYRLMIALNNMRSRQKKAIKALEQGKKIASRGNLLCKTCKINYSSSKKAHAKSKLHRNIEKFLKPKCNICSLKLNSPLSFEMHSCSYNHLVKAMESSNNRSDDILGNFDLCSEDFVTVDEVGVVDEEAPDSVQESSLKGKDNDSTKSESSKKNESSRKNESSKKNEGGTVAKTTNKTAPAKKLATKKTALAKKTTLTKKTPVKVVNPTSKQPKIKGNKVTAKVVEKEIESVEGGNPLPGIKKPNPEPFLGTSFVRRLEILFCDVCMEFLPEEKPEAFEELTTAHCKSSKHQIAFEEMKSHDCVFNEDELDYEPDELL